MRDAESMLDQLLSSAPDTIDERRVRDLLGLADAEAVDGFVEALVDRRRRDGDRPARRSRGARPRRADPARPGHRRHPGAAGRGAGVRRRASDPPARRRRAPTGGHRPRPRRHRRPSAAARARALHEPWPVALPAVGSPPPLDGARPPSSVRRPRPRNRPRHAPQPVPPRAAGAGRGARRAPPRPRRPRSDQGRRPSTDVDPALEAAADPATTGPAEPAPRPTSRHRPRRAVPVDARAGNCRRRGARRARAGTPQPRRPRAAPDAAAAAVPARRAPAEASTPRRGRCTGGLVAAWPEVVARLSRQPAVKPLITACRPVAVDGAIVTLGFPEDRASCRTRPSASGHRSRPASARSSAARSGSAASSRTSRSLRRPSRPGWGTRHGRGRRIFADDMADVGEVH